MSDERRGSGRDVARDNQAQFGREEKPSMSGTGVPRRPRFLDRVRQAIRLRNYSTFTEKAYVAWIRRFILFPRKTSS